MDYHGRCLVDERYKRIWVNIPKNASNSISKVLLNHGWKAGNFNERQELQWYKPFVVLRDPLKRWQGSMAEITRHKIEAGADKKELDDFYEGKTYFDEAFYSDIHFIPQVKWLEGLQWNDIDFFWMSYMPSLERYLGYGSIPHMNSSYTEERMDIMARVLSIPFESISPNVKIRYSDDYDYINYLNKNKLWWHEKNT